MDAIIMDLRNMFKKTSQDYFLISILRAVHENLIVQNY